MLRGLPSPWLDHGRGRVLWVAAAAWRQRQRHLHAFRREDLAGATAERFFVRRDDKARAAATAAAATSAALHAAAAGRGVAALRV